MFTSYNKSVIKILTILHYDTASVFSYYSFIKKIEITSKGRILRGRIFKKDSDGITKPTILILHGWGNAQDRFFPLAKILSNKGFACVTFNMTGHGETEGEKDDLTPSDFLNDAIAAYDFAVKISNANVNKIKVVGSSFGSYIACLLVSKRPVKNLALRVPADYPNSSFNQSRFTHNTDVEKLEWRSQKRNHDESYALEALNNFDGNALIVESGNDEIVPHQNVQNFVASVSNKDKLTYMVMEGAPHS